MNEFSREESQKFASCGTEKVSSGDSASCAIWGEAESELPRTVPRVRGEEVIKRSVRRRIYEGISLW